MTRFSSNFVDKGKLVNGYDYENQDRDNGNNHFSSNTNGIVFDKLHFL
mgnify:CR=1 FL=1